jgi:capsular polysaccharide biosynthesis protein
VTPREYLAAVCRRWPLVAATALLGAVVGGGLAAAAPPSYQASTSLYVGAAAAAGDAGSAYAARVRSEVLPSLASVALSPAVLEPVVTGLGLRVSTAALAEDLAVRVEDETSLLVVTATAAGPAEAARLADRVGTEVRRQAAVLFVGAADTPLLSVETVAPAREPRFASSPPLRRAAALGLVAGAAVAVLGSGLLQLARPMVRSAADARSLTSVPVLAELPVGRRRRHRGTEPRTEALDRLRWLLESTTGGAGSLTLTGLRAAALGTELGGGTGRPRVVPDPAQLLDRSVAGGVTGVLVVVDGRRTTRRRLDRVLALVADSGLPLVGLVVDRVPRSGTGPVRSAWALLTGRARWVGAEVPGARRPGRLDGAGVVAVLGLLAVGFDGLLPLSMTTGSVATTALLPLWLPALWAHRGARSLAVLTVLGVGSGWLLAGWSAATHDFAASEAVGTGFRITTALGVVGLVLWARSALSLPVIGVAFGLGRLADGLLHASSSLNPYKFEYALPLTIIVLALLSGRSRPLATAGALAVLGLLDIANDARSAFAFCAVSAALVLWQARPTPDRVRVRRWASVAFLGAAAMGAYAAGSQLLLSGGLGSEVQARTERQIAQTGSLLLGGRPEWTATWALMQDSPAGFGLGTVPSTHDVAVAAEGMAVTHIPTAEGYLKNYMFAGRFELHSVIADLWAHLGPVGLLLGLTMAVVLVRAFADAFARRQASGLLCFVTLTGLWGLFFSPLPTDLLVIALALGLGLAQRGPAVTTPGPTGARPASTGSLRALPTA